MRTSWILVACAALVMGCPPSTPPVIEPDGSAADTAADTLSPVDTGVQTDTGVPPDTGVLTDAEDSALPGDTMPEDTPSMDTGVPPTDTGVPPDTGVPTDTGVPGDVPGDTPVGGACRADGECAPGLTCERPPGRCVQCTSAAQCMPGQVCASNRCVAAVPCTTSRMCPGQVCSPTMMRCVDCNVDGDCTTMGEVCRASVCVVPPTPCRGDGDCASTTRVCDTAAMVCVECNTDAHCGAGRYCGPGHACRPRVCTPGASRCLDVTRARRCDDRGTAEVDVACGAGERCVMDACARPCTPGEESCAPTGERRRCNADGITYTLMACPGTLTCSLGACVTCMDTDLDSVSDVLEGAPGLDTDRDGTPDFRDTDSDDDGFSDRVESTKAYPGYESHGREVTCGGAPDNCDAPPDRAPNHQDLDSDNDGLADADERMARTDPCGADTDLDGVSDLVERVAGSNPLDRMSLPPSTGLYVVLPHHDPTVMVPAVRREFTFQTRIRSADVMFLVDTTGSMGSTLASLRSNLSTMIIPGIVRALGGPMADVRYGVAEFRDFAEGGDRSMGDFALRIPARMSTESMPAQRAVDMLMAAGGGDGPEAQVPALHALLTGFGVPNYGGLAVRPATAADCAGDAMAFGWGCFRPGRVPIFVLFSDADWHNGPMVAANFYRSVPTAPLWDALVTAMRMRNAYFLGIDVGSGATLAVSQNLARATGTVDAMGMPIAFRGTPMSVATNVVDAVTTLTGQTRQNITTRVVGDPMERRLPMGRSTADFVTGVAPVRGEPEAPTGYERRDMTTFYNVAPSTRVTFAASFDNTLARGGASAQVFTATIQVLGRAGTVVDSRPVFIQVPAAP